jgi:hypothetical protein
MTSIPTRITVEGVRDIGHHDYRDHPHEAARARQLTPPRAYPPAATIEAQLLGRELARARAHRLAGERALQHWLREVARQVQAHDPANTLLID